MKKYRFFFVLLVVLLAGCQSHFYKVKENTLYFYLNYPEANNVQLRCSLDDYKVHSAKKIDDDMWEVSVPFKSEFAYFYIVDDDIFLPSCRLKEKDDFGSENCIFVPDMGGYV